MAYFALNTALLSVTVVAYFVVHFRSIKIDRIASGLLFLAFVCMMAFRPDTVGDTIPYMNLFASMGSYKFTLGLGRVYVESAGHMEIAFVNLCKLTSLISSSYQFFFFVVAFLNVGVGVFSIMLISSSMHEGPKVEYRILPVFLLFISYYGFWYSGILLRGGLAISFCMLSYAMIVRKRYVFAVLAYLLAFSFHNSALIFLIVIAVYLFFPTGKIRTYRIAAVAIIVLYVVRFFDLFQSLAIQVARIIASHVRFLNFLEYYLNPTNYTFRSNGFLKTVLFFMLEFLFLTFCFTDNISKKQKKNLNVIMVVSVISGLLGVFPQINRIIDILFVAVLPSLYSLLIEVPSDERFHIGKTLSVRKFPVILSSLAVIAFANLVLYSLVAELLWPLIALLLGK